MEVGSLVSRVRGRDERPWLVWPVRLGLVAYGLVHLLIAWLALQLAFGHRVNVSQQGAMHDLASQPLGTVLLWLVALGFFALVVWRVVVAIWPPRRGDSKRVALERAVSVARAVVYAVLGVTAIRIAVGSGSTSSSQQLTSRLMSEPFGRVLVALVGVVIVVVACVLGYRGATASFVEDLHSDATGEAVRPAIVGLGRVGYLAKAFAFLVLGGLFIWSALTYEASKSGGLNQSMTTLLGAGVGPWLLVAVALGIAAFGLYCFGWARYPDTST